MAATIHSTDPLVHSEHIQQLLQDLIAHTRQDLGRIDDPRYQALLETTAEVLGGLQNAYRHFREGTEKAFKR
jgi:hypothetical protein